MVTRLQEAFEEVSKLPAGEQERADFILDELREERSWPQGETGFDLLLREARHAYQRGLSDRWKTCSPKTTIEVANSSFLSPDVP
jgi:hypothetical protein